MIHEFKTDTTPFEAIWRGSKKAEYRDLRDRISASGDNFRFPNPGHLLLLREHWGPEWTQQAYTGRFIRARITHVQIGYGIPEMHAMMSFEIIEKKGGVDSK